MRPDTDTEPGSVQVAEFPVSESSTALLTDRYELTALSAALADGTAERTATFEVFARRLPAGRRYGVVAGVDRVADAVRRFRFDDVALDYLGRESVVDAATVDWLAGYRFRGDIHAYPDGELYFPHSPVLVVDATFAEAVVLETVILSVLNHDCAVAAAASRMVNVAGGRPLLEMGGRRTHEQAAVAAARAAFVAGFAATSNLEAGRTYGIPTVGTAMHAFTLAHESEADAFRSQIRAQGVGTTLLVDTYDIPAGITTALDVAHEFGAAGPGAIRIDSGDPAVVVPAARAQLDAAGATATRIVLTGDLDEFAIARLAALPIDGYGVGTSVVTGSGHPAAGLVFKLVAIGDGDGRSRAVAKASAGKMSVGGRKDAHRVVGDDGMAVDECVTVRRDGVVATVPQGSRPLLHPVVVRGEVVGDRGVDAARDRHRAAVKELAPTHRRIDDGPPAFTAQPS